ncbi:hypothetical protein RD792_000928 [Penstemon davidsonii]|uniref:Uncharacterized protein n=1 Tax=Penstemon davidsonii TaxID=160366 RepID=A0ABR0DM17_9LAMI|nr:hypothetical protein RD792_000928 [Penstemon davidsonii]
MLSCLLNVNEIGETSSLADERPSQACSSGDPQTETSYGGKIEIVLAHSNERVLGFHLLQFAEVLPLICGYFRFCFQVVEEACTTLLPNTLCDYLYNLSDDFIRETLSVADEHTFQARPNELVTLISLHMEPPIELHKEDYLEFSVSKFC